MADDHPLNAPAPLITVGTTFGRFDHRAPRSPDSDGFRFNGAPGHIYRLHLDVDHPAPDQQRASTGGLPDYWFNGVSTVVEVVPGAAGERFISVESGGALVIVTGMAQPDGTSTPYRLIVDDLGLTADPQTTPENTPSVAVGEWYNGEITASLENPWDANNDYDVFTVPSTAGRRYTLEYETLDANGGYLDAFIAGYTDADDPRYARFSLWNGLSNWLNRVDSVVDGTLAVQVRGVLAQVGQTLHYRVRLVDAGPAQFDDHADWASAATPIQVDVPVEFTLNDPPLLRPYGGDDVDCFRVELAAGRRYSVTLKPAPGSLVGYGFSALTISQGLSNEALATRWANDPVEFKPFVGGSYTIRCAGAHQLMRQVLLVEDKGAVTDDFPDQLSADAHAVEPGAISGVINDQDDVDIIKLNAPTGSLITATLRGEDGTWLPLEVELCLNDQYYTWSFGELVGVASSVHTPPPSRALAVPRWNGEAAVFLRVIWPRYSADVAPPRAYTIDVQVSQPDTQDDWPDTPDGAVLIAPGDPSRWAFAQHDGDVDVFVADLVAGHVYRISGSPAVAPLNQGATNMPADPNQPRGLVQAAQTARYQVAYAVSVNGPSEVSIEDLGAVSDDFPTGKTVPKLGPDAVVNGQIDFAGDVDAWSVQPTEAGLYEIELTASPTVNLDVAAGESGAVSLSSEDFSYPPTEGPRRVVAQFPVIDDFGVLPLINIAASSYLPGQREYSVTVRLVQTFRGASGGDSAESAAAIGIGQWVPAVPQQRGRQHWFSVPVSEGRLYFEESSDTVYGPARLTVIDAEGTAVVENGSSWVARSTGTALIGLSTDSMWFRFRIVDGGLSADDHQASWEAATPLELGRIVSGVIGFEGDVDTFRLPPGPIDQYTVVLEHSTEQPAEWLQWSTVDPRVPWFTSWQYWPLSSSAMPLSDAGGALGEPGAFSLRVERGGFVTPVHYTLWVIRACPADIAGVGAVRVPDGLLDNNDLVVFIDEFFTGSPQADIGRDGGEEGPDDRLDNNDFIVFINRFFAGCP